MITITDSNILVSSLINPNGTIAEILTSKSKIQFFALDFILWEVRKHWAKIELRSPLKGTELKDEFERIKSGITFLSVDDIPPKYIKEAYEIVKDINEDDTFVIALNRYKRYKVWTGDEELMYGLKQKGFDTCITTEETQKEFV